MKRVISSLILISLLTSLFACQETESDTISTSEATTSEAVQAEYEYPELNLNGDSFTILNPTTTWGFYTYVDHEEQTGDTLDDAVYDRNRGLEERWNFKFDIVEEPLEECAAKIRSAVMSGDDVYDIVFNASTYNGSLVTEGLYCDLYDIPEFQLDKEWWEQSVIKESVINGDSLYFALTDFTLFGIESAWCVFFNETMLADLGLDRPYDLVREGKWTLDALREYAKAGANLNGDDSFDFNVDGNAIYGFATSYAFPHAMIIGSGERYITNNSDGYPEFSLETDRFYTLVSKYADFASAAGEFVSRNNSGNDHYEMIFKNRRALFLGAELKAAQKYRDFDDTFGIVPVPKLDEAQDSYHSVISKAAPVMCLPITNSDQATAGIIMDALTYESYTDILPIFYGVTIEQKGLRNEESIEMLDIIRSTRFFDVGDAYGWTTSIQDSIRRALDVGNDNIASIIASNKDAVNAAIEATMDLFNNQD